MHRQALAYWLRLRRVPNPQCTARLYVPLFLFDRFDALSRVALERGGTECLAQAVLARGEIGIVRDSRFVTPGLDADDLDVRLVSLAAVTFLRVDGALFKVRQLIEADREPGVRTARSGPMGLWAAPMPNASSAVGHATIPTRIPVLLHVDGQVMA